MIESVHVRNYFKLALSQLICCGSINSVTSTCMDPNRKPKLMPIYSFFSLLCNLSLFLHKLSWKYASFVLLSLYVILFFCVYCLLSTFTFYLYMHVTEVTYVDISCTRQICSRFFLFLFH